MQWNAKRIIRIFFLFLYALYAFTPVHMYAMAGGGGTRGLLHTGKHASTDIVWANVLYSILVDDDDTPPAGVGISADAPPADDVVLVKKRRALLREQFDAKPLFDIEVLPPGGLERTYLSAEYETSKDLLLRETDICLVLNTGLSPPSLILS
jgi:hypothetical protein